LKKKRPAGCQLDWGHRILETHGRIETETLLQGLEVLVRKPIVYRNLVMVVGIARTEQRGPLDSEAPGVARCV
jgi:hypothetical protein